MEKIGIVIVSHSYKIGEGTVDLVSEMLQNDEKIKLINASGTEDRRIGTSTTRILDAFAKCEDCKEVFVFYDIGSAEMSSEIAVEMFDDEKVTLVKAPIVEGAFVASVTALVSTEKNVILEELSKLKEEL